MRILVTGADGFIGRNLRTRLRECQYEDVVCITRDTTQAQMAEACLGADFVFHLAGVNRPQNETEYSTGNAGFTAALCDALRSSGRGAPVVYASSVQADLDNPYGRSKRAAEEVLQAYRDESGASIYVFRLANVFGKWSRPHYNSAVATFCHQIARGLPISVNDSKAVLRLMYIDDVVSAFLGLLANPHEGGGYVQAQPVYETTVGEVAMVLSGFAEGRSSLLAPRGGKGMHRALYATYVSFLPPEAFAYQIPSHGDSRGEFVEMLKTPEHGQFSYFTAGPGVTRGEHYHHSKTEKFLVIRGTAHFAFRHIDTGEKHELVIRGGEARIVETVPGWTHNISNIGETELVVMLWANEIFDHSRPDTIAMRVAS
jgi:UDP-2-acetamido-2,6-beta-L-arabino-hexul-4-ose reductase